MINILNMDIVKHYNTLLNLIRECSTELDTKYGHVMSGSPQLIDNIKKHYERNHDDLVTQYGMQLVSAFESITIYITSDPDRHTKFMEAVR